MTSLLLAALTFLAPAAAGEELLAFPEKPVDPRLGVYREAVLDLHERALRTRDGWSEADLRQKVPRKWLALDERYGKLPDSPAKARALAELALIYAELAWSERIAPLVRAVGELDRKLAAKLGTFAESEHFFVRVVGAEERFGRAALELAEAAREGYRNLFGLEAISKVPGKKVRILIRVDPSVRRPRLYFHPSPPYHSELRYEVPEKKYLTLAGKQRIVYGFSHELGHMLAMWGRHGEVEDDRHAWAHYTGSLVVEEVYDRLGNEPWPTWTAYQRRASGKERLLRQIEGVEPGLASYEAILALFHRIGEEFGEDVYGRAWKWLAKEGRFRRVNRVPYLWMKDLEAALLHVVKKAEKEKVRAMFSGRLAP